MTSFEGINLGSKSTLVNAWGLHLGATALPNLTQIPTHLFVWEQQYPSNAQLRPIAR